MSVFVTFIGDPETGDGPEVTTLWGQTFPKGEAVEVDDEKVISMAQNNKHFTVDEVGERKAAPSPEPVEEEADVQPSTAELPDIPDDWQSAKFFTRKAWAKTLRPDIAETLNTADEVDQVIAEYMDGWE